MRTYTTLSIIAFLVMLAALAMPASSSTMLSAAGPLQGAASVIDTGTRTLGTLPEIIGGGGAVLLLAGGLLVLLITLPLILLKSVQEDAQSDAAGGHTGGNYELGLKLGSALEAKHIDDILESAEFLRGAETTISQTKDGVKKIRVTGCRSCKGPLCDFERGYFQGAFEHIGDSMVEETACRATGAKFCEFTVKPR